MRKKILSLSLGLVVAVMGFSIFLSKPAPVAHAGDNPAPNSIQDETKITEANQYRLLKAQPPVTLDKSLERANINARLKFLNDENRIGYVYLLADTGQVITSYTIKGKASSLNSYITQMEVVDCPYNQEGCVTREAPDLDGSYGHNVEGVFFFTTDGVYVEWSGKYIYSSQLLNVNTPVSLTRAVQ